MEFIANETLRTAMENSPAFVENLNRRCSFSIDATASSSGTIGCTIKHGNLFRRISCHRSTCNDSTKSTASTTPMSTPNSSQNNSRAPSPAFPSIPELSVVDKWSTSPIPSTTSCPPLKFDHMESSSSQPMERVSTSRDQSFP